jgi:hypothetical protein
VFAHAVVRRCRMADDGSYRANSRLSSVEIWEANFAGDSLDGYNFVPLCGEDCV